MNGSSLSRLGSIFVDLVCIAIFASIGRANHQEEWSIWGVANTAYPFGIGCFLGWVIVLLVFQYIEVFSYRNFLIIWAGTVIVGMIIRGVDKGTVPPMSFIITASVFLAAIMSLWRVVFIKIITPR